MIAGHVSRPTCRAVLDSLNSNLRHQREIFQDRVAFINAPFLGVSFDVNDLGIFGRMTFIVLLAILRYSLGREAATTKLVFREARERGNLGDVFARR